MNGVARSPSPQLCNGLTEVLHQLLIDGLYGSGGRQKCNQTWDVVYNQPRLTLALLQLRMSGFKLSCPVVGSFLKVPDDSLVFSESLVQLQRGGSMIGGDIYSKAFCQPGKVGPVRPDHQHSNVTIHS